MREGDFQIFLLKQLVIAEERANFHDGGCDGGSGGSGLRRYSYDYFAHPTEQSALAIPYKELDKIAAAAAAARKNDQNENFATAQEIGEDGGGGGDVEGGRAGQTGSGKITTRSRSRIFSKQNRSKIIDLGWKM